MSKKITLAALDIHAVARAAVTMFVAAMTFGFAARGRADTFNFSNTNPIAVSDTGTPPITGSLYPSSISVSGLDFQTISHLSITLDGLTHSFPSDLDIVLAGPGGQLSMLMSEVGGDTKFPVSDLTLTLDDLAANSLPINSALSSGTFKPTRQFPTLSFQFPSPAPAGSSSAPAALSVFNGTDPNGTWNLFVVDESSPDSGTISRGWSMEVTTVPEPGNFEFAALAMGCMVAIRRWRRRERSSI
jgi:subtilisin-like proprotein convertase family protein